MVGLSLRQVVAPSSELWIPSLVCLGQWDIYVTVTLALAGGSARTVYVHPSSDGKLTRIATGTDAQRAERLRAVRHRGVRAKLLALCPGMPPRVHPRGPQEQIGWEQVPELLLGGRQTTLAQAGVAPAFGFPTASPQGALADCAAATHPSTSRSRAESRSIRRSVSFGIAPGCAGG